MSTTLAPPPPPPVAAPTTDARRRAGPPRDPPLGLAAAAPRMAPAGTRAGAAHRRGRGHHGRARARGQRAGHRPERLRLGQRPDRDRQSRAAAVSPRTWPPHDSSSARSRRSSTRACRCPGRSPRSICAPRTRTACSASRCCAWSPGSYPVGAERGGGDPGRRDDVQPEGRLDLVGQRAAAAGGRNRREPQGPAGRFRLGGPRSDQLPVERDAALQRQWQPGDELPSSSRVRHHPGDHVLRRATRRSSSAIRRSPSCCWPRSG